MHRIAMLCVDELKQLDVRCLRTSGTLGDVACQIVSLAHIIDDSLFLF